MIPVHNTISGRSQSPELTSADILYSYGYRDDCHSISSVGSTNSASTHSTSNQKRLHILEQRRLESHPRPTTVEDKLLESLRKRSESPFIRKNTINPAGTPLQLRPRGASPVVPKNMSPNNRPLTSHEHFNHESPLEKELRLIAEIDNHEYPRFGRTSSSPIILTENHQYSLWDDSSRFIPLEAPGVKHHNSVTLDNLGITSSDYNGKLRSISPPKPSAIQDQSQQQHHSPHQHQHQPQHPHQQQHSPHRPRTTSSTRSSFNSSLLSEQCDGISQKIMAAIQASEVKADQSQSFHKPGLDPIILHPNSSKLLSSCESQHSLSGSWQSQRSSLSSTSKTNLQASYPKTKYARSTSRHFLSSVGMVSESFTSSRTSKRLPPALRTVGHGSPLSGGSTLDNAISPHFADDVLENSSYSSIASFARRKFLENTTKEDLHYVSNRRRGQTRFVPPSMEVGPVFTIDYEPRGSPNRRERPVFRKFP